MARDPLTGQGFVVSGGTWGVGRAVVIEAARRGANVVFCGCAASDEDGAEVIAEAHSAGGTGQVTFVPVDLSTESGVDHLFDVALELLPALHVAIHNVPVTTKPDARPLIDLSLSDWNSVLAVDLRQPFLFSRRAIQEFLAAGEGGRIVHVVPATAEASSASFMASHTALLALVRSIAKEYGRRSIACNAVAIENNRETNLANSVNAGEPFDQELLAVHQRPPWPAAVAEVVLFLASAEASFVSGAVLRVV